MSLLEAEIEGQALQAHEAAQQAITDWRASKTEDLISSFKAKFQQSDLTGLPQVHDIVAQIGTVQREASQVSLQIIWPQSCSDHLHAKSSWTRLKRHPAPVT